MNREADYDLWISTRGVTRGRSAAEAPWRKRHRLRCIAGRRCGQYLLDASQHSDGSNAARIAALRGHPHTAVALLKIGQRARWQPVHNLLEVAAPAASGAVPRSCACTAARTLPAIRSSTLSPAARTRDRKSTRL